jgi:hypothetical protein
MNIKADLHWNDDLCEVDLKDFFDIGHGDHEGEDVELMKNVEILLALMWDVAWW